MVVCATMVVFLLVTAYFTPRGVQRALALFLITYCLVGSFTEVGFTNVNPYLLELTPAASLLVSSAAGKGADVRVAPDDICRRPRPGRGIVNPTERAKNPTILPVVITRARRCPGGRTARGASMAITISSSRNTISTVTGTSATCQHVLPR